jgi:hypothetical protein
MTTDAVLLKERLKLIQLLVRITNKFGQGED